MTWARLDDSFHSHPKTIRVLRRRPEALALFSLALSWIANHEKDGRIPSDMFEIWMPKESERDGALSILLEVGFLHQEDEDYLVHDYLDYNLSKETLEERRESDRRRKAAARG